MIRIAICDDEIMLLETKLKELIFQSLGNVGLRAEISYFSDGMLLLNEFERHNIFDIVILDIDMPQINGKELAVKLRAIDSEFTLAFFTAYAEEVFSAIPIGISAFIPKCFDDDKVSVALSELFCKFAAKNPQWEIFDILVDGVASTIKIPISNIYYFQLSDKIIKVHTYNESFILSERVFEKIAEKYIQKGFYRINRACIVNVAKVNEVLAGNLIMDNGDKLMVSRRTKKGLICEMTALPIISGVT